MSISGDRHLRPEPSGKLKGLLAGARTVLVRSDASYAESFAGQALLHLLVNLLARQFGVIDTVWLDVPMVPLYPGNWILPLAQHSNLLESLLELGKSVGGGEVGVEPVRSDGDATVTVLVGPGVGPHG